MKKDSERMLFSNETITLFRLKKIGRHSNQNPNSGEHHLNKKNEIFLTFIITSIQASLPKSKILDMTPYF